MEEDPLLGSKAIDRALTFALLEMTPSGMRFIKFVNVFEGIKASLDNSLDKLEQLKQ